MNKWICSSMILLLVIISCQKKYDDKKNTPDQLRELQRPETLTILDQNKNPVPGAGLMIGNTVTESAWYYADENGEIPVPNTWQEPAEITIRAPLHQTLTLINQNPLSKVFTLKKIKTFPNLKMRGEVTGITTKDKDGFIDFSLVVESFKRMDIFQFDLNKIISPTTQNITVIGKDISLPQNIFLPKQKENYFVPITFSKPNFALDFSDYGAKSLTALRGRFPFKKVISEIQNKVPYFEIVNYFEMLSSGQINLDFQSNSPLTSIPSDQLKFELAQRIRAPDFPTDQVMFGINCLKKDSIYTPIDIKQINSKEPQNLKSLSLSNSEELFLGVIKNKAEFNVNDENQERMSLVILPWGLTSNPQFLSLIENPKSISSYEFMLSLPNIPQGLMSLGFAATISEVKSIPLDNGKKADVKIPIWEIYSPQWENKITIPNLDLDKNKAYRIEISLMGKNLNNAGKTDFYSLQWSHETQIETATHITKSAVNF